MEGRPLVMTRNEGVLDDLLRVAAAAGVEVLHGTDAGARMSWRSAAVVLIDHDLVGEAVAAGLAPRPGVVAVGRAAPGAELLQQCLRLGVGRTLTLGVDDDDLIGVLAGTLQTGPGNGRAVAVLGACGGAGASVFASALAVSAERAGRPVVLADCDPWGSGLDVLLGIEDRAGIRWDELAAPSGRLPPDALHRALPSAPFGRGRVAVLCAGRAAPADIPATVVDVVLQAGRLAGDLTIADLPRHPTAAADRVIEQADLVVVVVTADVRGCFSAARLMPRLFDLGASPQLVVRGPSPGGIGARDVADAVGVPVAAWMRPQPSIGRDLERGRPPGTGRRGPLARAASAVLVRLERICA